MAKKKFRTIINVQQRSPKFVIVLAALGLVGFFFLAWFMDHFIEMGNYSAIFQQGLFLLNLIAPTILIYYIMDQPPYLTTWEVVMIMGIVVFNFFFITKIAPHLMPSIFQSTASVLQSNLNSIVGLT
jgi:hypothetical protein